jgi:hypothetical protein
MNELGQKSSTYENARLRIKTLLQTYVVGTPIDRLGVDPAIMVFPLTMTSHAPPSRVAGSPPQPVNVFSPKATVTGLGKGMPLIVSVQILLPIESVKLSRPDHSWPIGRPARSRQRPIQAPQGWR